MRALVYITFLKTVLSSSFGLNTTCQADLDIGCTSWQTIGTKVNRLNCTDPSKGPMPWVMKPIRSNAYTVRTGDLDPSLDKSTYEPGALISIYIRVVKKGFKFRGIAMHAVASNGSTVGAWEIPSEKSFTQTVSDCGQGFAIHKGAEVKPQLIRLLWRAPSVVGLGAVAFRTLIKEGTANDGYFYYPMDSDLILQEKTQASYSQLWYEAASTQSCTAACALVNKACAEELLASLNSPLQLDRTVSTNIPCEMPYVSSCQAHDPVATSRYCTFRSPTCASWRANVGNSSCAAVPTDGAVNRLCPCRGDALSAALSAAPSTFSSFCSLAVGLFTLVTSRDRSTVLASVLLTLLNGVTAHNWQLTAGRNMGTASGIWPCKGRTSSDTHAQVGPNQPIVFGWSPGHSGYVTIIVLHERDYARLNSRALSSDITKYIKQAPPNSSTHLSNPRVHHASSTTIDMVQSDLRFLKPEVTVDDPWFLNHPRRPSAAGMIFKFNQSYLSSDRRYDYYNPNVTWIESLHRFPVLGMPTDRDLINITIPGRKGAGHYIIHWSWQGYSDCTDVDFFLNRTVENPYGIVQKSYVYSKTEHCQYTDWRYLKSPCLDATISAERCTDTATAFFKYLRS